MDKLFDELTDEEKEQAVLKALNENDLGKWYWDSIKDNFYTHISYLDYNDYLTDSTIAEIVNECKPKLSMCADELNDKMWYWWEDALTYDWNEIFDNVISNLSDDLNEDEADFRRQKTREKIQDILEDYVAVDPPINEIMDRSEVKVVISLETGDYSFDELGTYIESEDDISEKYKGTAIEWLVNQQGYSLEQLKQEWENGDTGSKFLKSLVTEIREVWGYAGLELTFLVKTNVEQLFHQIYYNAENGKISQQLTISKDALCGLLDSWNNGLCGYFIELEKDVVIPANMLKVTGAFPDAAYRYGPDDICGFSSEAWKGEVKIG